MSIRRLAAVAAAAALLTFLAGCTPSSSPSSESEGTTPAPTSAAPEITEAEEGDAESARLDALGAIDAALQHTPGDVVELEFGRERTTLVWEVGVLQADGSGVELYLDANSGEVVRESTLRLSSVQSAAPTVAAAEVVGIALDAVSGRVITLDLDTERGRTVWEVEVLSTSGGTELYIDAETGEVVKQERMS